LPLPVRGGCVDGLRAFLNVRGEDDFVLRVAWLVAALRGRGPYPVGAFSGEQGSAKTYESSILRRTIDPNAAPVRLVPREARDLMIAAANSHVVAFDNLSRIPPWLSDALCALASGTGFSTRELYSNDDEALFTAARPVIVNGITDVVTRPDLLDRALLFHCEPIPDEGRRPEDDLNAALRIAHPGILGSLLDAVSAALRTESVVRLARFSRMADFERWTVAATTSLPWSAVTFLAAYAHNREGAVETSLDGDPLADAVGALAASATSGWQGTSAELLRRGQPADTERTARAEVVPPREGAGGRPSALGPWPPQDRCRCRVWRYPARLFSPPPHDSVGGDCGSSGNGWRRTSCSGYRTA